GGTSAFSFNFILLKWLRAGFSLVSLFIGTGIAHDVVMATTLRKHACPQKSGENRVRRGLDALLLIFVVFGQVVLAPSAFSQIVPGSPTTQWVPILYGNSFPDASADQQTGSSESDIVGNTNNPSLY